MAVITISKEHGAGGKQLAEAIARSLSYELIDKALIAKVAQQAKVGAEKVEKYDQEGYSSLAKYLDNLFLTNPTLYAPGAFDLPVSASGMVTGLYEKYDFFNSEQYLKLTQTAIESLYQKGNVVLVGRGGQVLLAGKPGCLHLRLAAPCEARIKRMTAKLDITEKEAAEIIHKRDKSRASYIRDYYGKDWNDAALYHLVINTAMWNEQQVAALVQAAVKQLT
ncbi:MAG: cytidylate kinase-like family protein [Candidatus Edwardsbacteria bacterium]|nr:cytidylate kinase-like family protein [Candidatus Edwardsbacteria bacterium]